MFSKAFSPAAVTSSADIGFASKTLAWSMKSLLVLNLLSEVPFPTPKRRDVVSQPRRAWMKRIFEQTSVPSCFLTVLIFQMRVGVLMNFLGLFKYSLHPCSSRLRHNIAPLWRWERNFV